MIRQPYLWLLTAAVLGATPAWAESHHPEPKHHSRKVPSNLTGNVASDKANALGTGKGVSASNTEAATIASPTTMGRP